MEIESVHKSRIKAAKHCAHCGEGFYGSRSAKFCSETCRSTSYGIRKNSGISASSTGAIGELRVCADLLSRHYDVYRAVSPACRCDLTIIKHGTDEKMTVECRTGFISSTGKLVTTRVKMRADVLAIVLSDRIIYEPDLP